MINSKENISIRKKDLVNSKLNSPIASKTIRFWHKATEGDTVINLLSLNFPSAELPTAIQPSVAQLTALNLVLIKNNVKLYSFLEGELQQHDSYKIRDNYNIDLTGGMSAGAQADEIFMCEINLVPTEKIVVADSREVWRTYPLTAGQTVVPLGEDFQIRNLSYQIGSILIMKNGVTQYRCVNNELTGEGNYIEIDSGNGNSSSIELKSGAIEGDSLMVYFGLQFSGDLSMWGQIEALSGAVLKLAQDVSENIFDNETSDRYLSANPSEIDRRSFGDQVLNNKSLLDAIGELYASKYNDENYLCVFNCVATTVTLQTEFNNSTGILINKPSFPSDSITFTCLKDCFVTVGSGITATNNAGWLTIQINGVTVGYNYGVVSASDVGIGGGGYNLELKADDVVTVIPKNQDSTNNNHFSVTARDKKQKIKDLI